MRDYLSDFEPGSYEIDGSMYNNPLIKFADLKLYEFSKNKDYRLEEALKIKEVMENFKEILDKKFIISEAPESLMDLNMSRDKKSRTYKQLEFLSYLDKKWSYRQWPFHQWIKFSPQELPRIEQQMRQIVDEEYRAWKKGTINTAEAKYEKAIYQIGW